MGDRGTFWPFGARAAIVSTAVLLVALTVGIGLINVQLHWPPTELLGAVLLGAVLVALLPVLLLVLDRLAGDGGSFAIAGVVELTFQAARSGPGASDMAGVSENLGVPPGVALLDSDRGRVMETLADALSNPIAVIDLGDGDEWWESRLLLFLSGAARLDQPRAVVFVGTCHRQVHRFLGWGEPRELLQRLLSVASPDLQNAHHSGRADAVAWELSPDVTSGAARPPWPGAMPIQSGPQIGARGSQLVPEGLLMKHLLNVEQQKDKVQPISIGRLDDLFGPLLTTRAVEESASWVERLTALLATTDPYLAVVAQGRYVTVIPRDQGINAVLRGVVRSQSDSRAGRPRSSAAPTA